MRTLLYTMVAMLAMSPARADAVRAPGAVVDEPSGIEGSGANGVDAAVIAIIAEAARKALAPDVDLVEVARVRPLSARHADVGADCDIAGARADERIRRSRDVVMHVHGQTKAGKPCAGSLVATLVTGPRAASRSEAPSLPRVDDVRAVERTKEDQSSRLGHPVDVVLHVGRITIETRGSVVRCAPQDRANSTCARLAGGRLVAGETVLGRLHVRGSPALDAEKP